MKNTFSFKLFVTNAILYSIISYGTSFLFDKFGWFKDPSTNVYGFILTGLIFAVILSFFIKKTLRSAFNQLHQYAKTVADSCLKLVEVSTEMASSSTEQASAIQETATTLTELNATIKQSTENAERSSEAATSSQNDASEGQRAVKEMIQAIHEINSSNNTIMTEINANNDKIANIVKVITEISNKTKVINDIVFQTKLLSFNASVEAARAGEHGKGFAVVAEEIGNLAAMSGNASQEINAMLNESIKKVNSIVGETKNKIEALVEVGKSKVDRGVAIADRCGNLLEQVVKNVTEVNNMVDQIASSSKEQALGTNEIATAMTQLDKVIQQNTEITQKTAEYAELISSQTEILVKDLEAIQGTHGSFTNNKFKKPYIPQTNYASSSSGANVIPFKPVEKSHLSTKVVGTDIPSSNDNDFEEL
jgi:methyl-accepting chemotaxis protein